MTEGLGDEAGDYLPVDLTCQNPPPGFPVVTDSKISALPFTALEWNAFELLLCDVACAVDRLAEVRRYGVSGQEQAGVDVIGRAADGSWHAYQAKKVIQFTKAHARAALEAFVEGRRPFGARRLVIATACRGTRAEISDLIYEYRATHPELEFDLVWDAEYLSSVLRRQPHIVGRYFGDVVAWRFCDVDALSVYRSAGREQGGVPVGASLSELDPFDLGVHEAISVAHASELGAKLPLHVRRALDDELERCVQRAVSGQSAVAVLVGDSSTGKTRAAWEALRLLPADWRIWQPRDRDELLEARGRIAPRTVLWLDEVKDFLLSGDTAVDERVAAGIDQLIHDPGRAPLLVLGGAWRDHWIQMTAAAGDVDDRKHSRTLLEKHRVDVPECFTDEEIAELLLGQAGHDPRLREATESAEDGHITQYLAGGPAQLRQYENAPTVARAVLDAAVDASRLGRGFQLTAKFLAAAAEASLTGLQRDLLLRDDHWFESVIEYTNRPCRGARGVLSPVRPPLFAKTEQLPTFRLADYVEQEISRRRAHICPPDGFWLAAEHCAANGHDRFALVSAALSRGRIDAAERLADRAAEFGEPHGLVRFAEYLEKHHPDRDSVPFFERAAEAGDSSAQVKLAWRLERAGRLDEAERWYHAAADGGEPDAGVGLASVLWERGEHEAAMDLYEEALDAGHARSVEYQARHLARTDDHELALALTRRSFEAGNTEAFTGLAWSYMYSDHERAIAVFLHAIEAGDVNALREMAYVMEWDDRPAAAELFCALAVEFGEVSALRGLGMIRAGKGDLESARALFWHAYNAGLGWVLPQIAELHEQSGALHKAERIYRRCLRELDSDEPICGLVRVYEKTGRHRQAEALALTVPERAVPDLARLRAERGDSEDAERLLLCLVDTGYTSALLTIGGIREKVGDLAGAEMMLRRAQAAGAFGAQRALKAFDERRGDTPPSAC